MTLTGQSQKPPGSRQQRQRKRAVHIFFQTTKGIHECTDLLIVGSVQLKQSLVDRASSVPTPEGCSAGKYSRAAERWRGNASLGGSAEMDKVASGRNLG